MSWWAKCGVTRPRHVKTLFLAGLKPERAIAQSRFSFAAYKAAYQASHKNSLCSRPTRLSKAFVSTLILNISSGRFEPSPRAGELIHSVAAATPSSNRENGLLNYSNRCDQAVACNDAEASRFCPTCSWASDPLCVSRNSQIATLLERHRYHHQQRNRRR